MTDYRETLQRIKTFPSLIKFLRHALDWPIIGDDFEELTFDYTPEELGIDTANAAKIQEIKRLRPLSENQPWGIFFVKFEPKRLPVVALRRILSRVVLKKRASANSAERASWQADDLLFVSNYGEGEERQISFAHFAQHGQKNDLPTLKVLGWDNLDTPLHLDHVADMLVGKLFWPDDPDDVDTWRGNWRAAFTLRHGEVITTSRDLAVRLAELARAIRDRIKTVLAIETQNGPVTKLMKAFQEALVHDLDVDGFADMYAQTIAYGLLAARVENPQGKTADDLARQMTNPFLKELMETFLHVGGRKGKAKDGLGLDFDELGVSEVVELLDAAKMEAVIRDFGDRKPDEDPVIHFYELFLKEYDAKKKMQRGIFYTPRPVVSYIVRSVDELLRTEFDLADGLADTTTWGEMAKRHKGLTIPEGAKPNEPFVQILDPATGTGTFLVEVIDLIHETMMKKWQASGQSAGEIERLWNDYVPGHLLPRLHGYELLMAPYAVAHMKIGLKLYETGYRFGDGERVRVYLTNALEPAQDFSGKLDFMIPALAHEAQAVNAIKSHQRFTVVIGNPPYAKLSSNRQEAAEALVEPFKYPVRGERNIQPLSDDYVKFLGFVLAVSKQVPAFVFSMISNRGYLNGLIHRGMRQVLLENFGKLWALDLHGDSNVRETSPDGRANENVFDIQQGVAITIGVKVFSDIEVSDCFRIDSWGTRNEKYAQLFALKFNDPQWKKCAPIAPHFFFQLSTLATASGELQLPLSEVMPATSTGIKTHRDELVIDFHKEALLTRIGNFVSPARSDDEVRRMFFGTSLSGRYKAGDNSEWSMSDARQELRREKTPLKVFVREIEYRPFDRRFIFYHTSVIDRAREKFMSHMEAGLNLALVITRQVPNGDFCHVFVTRHLIEMKTGSYDRGTNLFPIYLKYDSGSLNLTVTSRLNFSEGFVKAFSSALRLRPTGSAGLPEGFTPEDIFYYAYSVFHSPIYRSRYAEFLKVDFPRLPLPSSLELFWALAHLGDELVNLHLVEAPVQQAFSARYDQSAKAWRYDVAPGNHLPISLTFTGPATPVVGKVGWSDDTIWIDAVKPKKGKAVPAVPTEAATGTIGFRGVPEEVWNFRIGGYQVCQKWLKDRKGLTLSADDITHYHRIVIALHETIRLMKEIDEVIDQHGGWPGAFQR